MAEPVFYALGTQSEFKRRQSLGLAYARPADWVSERIVECVGRWVITWAKEYVDEVTNKSMSGRREMSHALVEMLHVRELPPRNSRSKKVSLLSR